MKNKSNLWPVDVQLADNIIDASFVVKDGELGLVFRTPLVMKAAQWLDIQVKNPKTSQAN